MTDAGSDKEQQAGQAAALRARLDYATALADWLDRMPQPPATTTVARTFGEILRETCDRLNKIILCGLLQEIIDHAVDASIQGEGAESLNEQIKQNAEDLMRRQGCASL